MHTIQHSVFHRLAPSAEMKPVILVGGVYCGTNDAALKDIPFREGIVFLKMAVQALFAGGGGCFHREGLSDFL